LLGIIREQKAIGVDCAGQSIVGLSRVERAAIAQFSEGKDGIGPRAASGDRLVQLGNRTVRIDLHALGQVLLPQHDPGRLTELPG